MGLLGFDRILAVYDAAIALGIDSARGALTAGLPRAIVAAIPSASDSASELMGTLHALNAMEALDSGDAPLALWLRGAAALSAGRHGGAVFEQALLEIQTGQTPSGQGQLRGGAPKAADPPAKIFDLGVTPTGFFQGRREEIAAVRAAFTRGGGRGTRVHALSGLAGIGKTQTALEYARLYREDYDHVLWVRGASAESVRASLAHIARRLGFANVEARDQGPAVDAVRRWLDENEGWLLVIDNLDTPELLQTFLPRSANGHVLLTSRAQVFQSAGPVTITPLEKLARIDAEQFLLVRTGRSGEVDEAELAAVFELARELGALPLALEQAAAYIVEHQARFDDYLQSFRTRRLALLEEGQPVTGDYGASVRTTWELSFRALAANPAAMDLLRLSAFFDADAIPFELLRMGAGEGGDAIRLALGEGARELEVNVLLRPLGRHSLVRLDVHGRAYSMHGLVQEVVRACMSTEEARTWAERAVRVAERAFPEPKVFTSWPSCERLLRHASACVEWSRAWRLDLSETASLLNRMAVYLKERARYEEAEKLFREALELREEALGPDHPEVARVAHDLAEMYWHRDRFAEAEQLYLRALRILERPPTDARRHATTLSYLAYLYYSWRRYEDAEPLHLRALSIRQAALDPNDPDVATSLNNLGRLYSKQKKYALAEAHFLHALRIREARLGPSHYHVGYTLNGLGNLYCDQGRYREAEPRYRRALDITVAALGPSDLRVVRVLDGLARLCREEGRHAEAEVYYRNAIDVVTREAGPARYLLDLHRDYALSLQAEGRVSEAEAMLVRASAIDATRSLTTTTTSHDNAP